MNNKRETKFVAMTDEFQAGVCAENWWMNPSQSNFGSSASSPIMDIISWPTDFDTKARASDDQSGSANSEGSIIFQDIQKPLEQDYGSLLSMNSTLQIMDNDLYSSIPADWNQTIFHDNKRNECNHRDNLLDSLNSSSNYQQHAAVDNFSQVKKDWSPEKFSTINEDFSMDDAYKGPTNIQGFPVSSTSYGYTSSLMQTLFDHTDSDQDTIFGNQSMEYPAPSTICQEKLNDFPSTLLPKPSPVPLPKQPLCHLNLPNNSAWNASNDGLFTSVQSQFFSPKFEDKQDCPNLSVKSNNERIRDMNIAVKNRSSTEPVFKRQRIETPSPLPTFKVRKEKLGDRVTALQQLVSPFGKTDTASVLHEAIEYIKLLHDQVTCLITPYIKGGSPIQQEQTLSDPKETIQELRSRGLCLVPLSSTFHVASETTADFWTPTFGGSLR